VHLAVGREPLIPRVMVNLPVDCDGDLIEVLRQRWKALGEREHQLSYARRVDGDLFEAFGVLRQAARKVDRRQDINSVPRALAARAGEKAAAQ